MIHVGILTPHEAAGADDELALMAGEVVRTRVARISVMPDGSAPRSLEDLRSHADPPLVDAAVARLDPASLDALAFASTSTAYAIGSRAERRLLTSLHERWGISACSTPEAAARALHCLGVDRLAVVHPPWFGQDRHALGVAYFREEGFSVAGGGLADVTDDPAHVRADEVVEWAAGQVPPDVEAVFLGGNGLRAASAIAPLEELLDRPVLESNQVLLWSVNESLGTPLDIADFGRLLNSREGKRS